MGSAAAWLPKAAEAAELLSGRYLGMHCLEVPDAYRAICSSLMTMTLGGASRRGAASRTWGHGGSTWRASKPAPSPVAPLITPTAHCHPLSTQKPEFCGVACHPVLTRPPAHSEPQQAGSSHSQ